MLYLTSCRFSLCRFHVPGSCTDFCHVWELGCCRMTQLQRSGGAKPGFPCPHCFWLDRRCSVHDMNLLCVHGDTGFLSLIEQNCVGIISFIVHVGTVFLTKPCFC